MSWSSNSQDDEVLDDGDGGGGLFIFKNYNDKVWPECEPMFLIICFIQIRIQYTR